MTAAQFEDLRIDEAAEVLAWRFDALCRSGFDLDAAAVLAANVEVDLHDLVPVRSQVLRKHFAHGDVVLDDQDAAVGRHGLPLSDGRTPLSQV